MLTVCEHNQEFSCRPLVCDSNATCGRLGGSAFRCEGQRCVAGRALATQDKVAACLAGMGEFRGTPAQLERITLARACTGSCTLPAVCAQGDVD